MPSRMTKAQRAKKDAQKANPSEGMIQSRIIFEFQNRLSTAVVAAVVNETNRSGRGAMLETQRKRGMGMLPGFPDMIVIYQGNVIFLEVKKPKGTLQPNQKAVHERLRRHGMDVRVIRSADDVAAIAEELRAMPRAFGADPSYA